MMTSLTPRNEIETAKIKGMCPYKIWHKSLPANTPSSLTPHVINITNWKGPGIIDPVITDADRTSNPINHTAHFLFLWSEIVAYSKGSFKPLADHRKNPIQHHFNQTLATASISSKEDTILKTTDPSEKKAELIDAGDDYAYSVLDSRLKQWAVKVSPRYLILNPTKKAILSFLYDNPLDVNAKGSNNGKGHAEKKTCNGSKKQLEEQLEETEEEKEYRLGNLPMLQGLLVYHQAVCMLNHNRMLKLVKLLGNSQPTSSANASQQPAGTAAISATSISMNPQNPLPSREILSNSFKALHTAAESALVISQVMQIILENKVERYCNGSMLFCAYTSLVILMVLQSPMGQVCLARERELLAKSKDEEDQLLRVIGRATGSSSKDRMKVYAEVNVEPTQAGKIGDLSNETQSEPPRDGERQTEILNKQEDKLPWGMDLKFCAETYRFGVYYNLQALRTISKHWETAQTALGNMKEMVASSANSSNTSM
jgi:hypothetical protein